MHGTDVAWVADGVQGSCCAFDLAAEGVPGEPAAEALIEDDDDAAALTGTSH